MRNPNFENTPSGAIRYFLCSIFQTRFICLGLLAVALPLGARAQSYSIDWWSIDGGGGASTGGVYTVTGTIGQPDAGPMGGGNFTLDGGFWSLIEAVQTPGAPRLSITRLGNSVIVSWPSPGTGFGLQHNGNVANPNGWSTFGGTISDNGSIRSVTISPPTGNLFFRLKQR